MSTEVSFETFLTLKDIETECDEPQVQVTANYIDAEPMVSNYGDGTGYPGSDAEVEILKVIRLDTKEELEWDSLPKACQEKLEEAVHEHVARDDGPD